MDKNARPVVPGLTNEEVIVLIYQMSMHDWGTGQTPRSFIAREDIPIYNSLAKKELLVKGHIPGRGQVMFYFDYGFAKRTKYWTKELDDLWNAY